MCWRACWSFEPGSGIVNLQHSQLHIRALRRLRRSGADLLVGRLGPCLRARMQGFLYILQHSACADQTTRVMIFRSFLAVWASAIWSVDASPILVLGNCNPKLKAGNILKS